MERDWKRLGRAITARREELGMTTQQALADAADVTRQSVQSLESANSGKGWTRTPKTLDAVRQALGWSPETVARLLAPEQGDSQAGGTAPLASGMPMRVVRELSSGQVVDTEIVELGIPGTSYKFVGILKQDTEATEASPEEQQRVLKEWSRVQRALRGVTDDQNDPT